MADFKSPWGNFPLKEEERKAQQDEWHKASALTRHPVPGGPPPGAGPAFYPPESRLRDPWARALVCASARCTLPQRHVPHPEKDTRTPRPPQQGRSPRLTPTRVRGAHAARKGRHVHAAAAPPELLFQSSAPSHHFRNPHATPARELGTFIAPNCAHLKTSPTHHPSTPPLHHRTVRSWNGGVAGWCVGDVVRCAQSPRDDPALPPHSEPTQD